MKLKIEMTESERQLRNGHFQQVNPQIQWVDHDNWIRTMTLDNISIKQFRGIKRLCFQALRLVWGIAYKLDRAHHNFHTHNHT
jgi:hypothetical protein